MPHAEKDTTNSSSTTTMSPTTNGDTPLTNGEKPSSKVLSHLQSYPLISDTLTLYRKNPYGAKTINLAHSLYHSLIAPLHPYLQTPYSYLSPYLSRADELGDTGLSKVDNRFPIVKEETGKLKERAQGYAFFPVRVVGQGREYLVGTFRDEYGKTKGEGGVVKWGKAVVSTELKIGHDGLNMVLGLLERGKETAAKKVE